MISFTIKTIGCKVNIYESNKIKDDLINNGLNYINVEEKENYDKLDLYIVNTCSVTSIADKKSRQMLHLARKYNKDIIVVAIGCLVDSIKIKNNKKNEEILSGIDLFISNKEKKDAINIILNYLSENKKLTLSKNTYNKKNNTDNVVEKTSENILQKQQVRSFVKIQDGCNQYCTYCIIPYLRGNIKSKDNDLIIEEVEQHVKKGAKEIVLTGIHLSSFGLDRVGLTYESNGALDVARKSLIEILSLISKINAVERIRLGSIEPRVINEKFLMSIKNDEVLDKKFCKSFCLSLQSGCDKTLKRMNRHYTTSDFRCACKIIRDIFNVVTITTDVIVGFPGESIDDYLESLNFVKEMRFYNPNIFPYSRRKGTKADEMTGQLTNIEKHKRVKRMIEECDKISKEIDIENDKLDNKILIEEIIEDNGRKYGVGYTNDYRKKRIPI